MMINMKFIRGWNQCHAVTFSILLQLVMLWFIFIIIIISVNHLLSFKVDPFLKHTLCQINQTEWFLVCLYFYCCNNRILWT